MKAVAISVVVAVVVAGMFVGGLFSQATLLMMIGFCGWSPAMLYVGWSIRGAFAGKRLALVDTAKPVGAGQRQPVPKSRLQRETEVGL